MTDTGHKVPNWGAFKAIGQDVCATDSLSSEHEISAVPPSMPVEDTETPPVFNPRTEIPDEGNFYACEHNFDRSEEEFDELGEGAIRQIGRNFISMASASVGVFAVIAAVMWSIPNGSPQDEIRVAMDVSESSLSNLDLPVPDLDASDFRPALASVDTSAQNEDLAIEYIEVDVVLPIPSVIAEANIGEAPEQSILMGYAGLSGPAPYPRSAALEAAFSLAEGPLAQGSDDEAVHVAPVIAESEPWVSVMIPVKRPVF